MIRMNILQVSSFSGLPCIEIDLKKVANNEDGIELVLDFIKGHNCELLVFKNADKYQQDLILIVRNLKNNELYNKILILDGSEEDYSQISSFYWDELIIELKYPKLSSNFIDFIEDNDCNFILANTLLLELYINEPYFYNSNVYSTVTYYDYNKTIDFCRFNGFMYARNIFYY